MKLPRRAANAVLALWVCVASTCGAVAHSHEGGGRPHSHHLGFLSVADGSRGPAAPTGPSARHWHLILCGIETGGLPAGSEDSSAPADPQAAAIYAADLGAVSPDGDSAVAAWNLSGPAEQCPSLPSVGVDAPADGRSSTAPPPAPSTCPKAALARSGVRLA